MLCWIVTRIAASSAGTTLAGTWDSRAWIRLATAAGVMVRFRAAFRPNTSPSRSELLARRLAP